MSPEIAVVVASHRRPLRLRWLLNALEEQTLGSERWETVVVHDSPGETDRLLQEHPLRRAGRLRALRSEPGDNPPGLQRNAGWRATSAPLVAFTDDDCRPPAEWLERALAAARAQPGAVVQGATSPEPVEAPLLDAAPHARTQDVRPPSPFVPACNVVYPRELLERVGGFDESLHAGEDTDLWMRARATGAPLRAAPEALVHHAVHAGGLSARVRSTWRWGDLAAVVGRHPELRRHCTARVFWKPGHAFLPLAAAAAAMARRDRRWAALALPWALVSRPRRGRTPRGLARALSELPGQAVVDAAEMAALLAGSLRHRAPLL